MRAVEHTFREAAGRLLEGSSGGILLAISGGVDSMVMAHLFIQWLGSGSGKPLQRKVAAAHMNFSLRQAESDGDQEFVEAWARRYDIPVYTKKVQTLDYASGKGLSTEMAARELRYQWFESLCLEHGFSFIAVAHNANDRAETMLLNLIRGTGLRGLCSMKEQNSKIIRPLLNVPRTGIVEYARENEIAYRTDSTNLETVYARNKIRHLVMPVLEQINPNVVQRMGKNADNLSQTQLLLDSLTLEKQAACATLRGFSIPCLARGGNVDFWLYQLLSPYGFNTSQIRGIAISMEGQSGKKFLSRSHILWIEREELVIRELANGLTLVKLGIEQVERTPDFVIPEDRGLAALDAGKLQFPLEVRKWKPGDRFMPLGMKGFKKISDFLVDQKVPASDKNDICVLCSGDDIAWVIGWRIDNRFRITDKTTTIMIFHQKADEPGSRLFPEDQVVVSL
ncbi:MAG TPA: tRNA lysidine(34) synthetase TilS [Bacteroidales bacterium]|nr:MAG: tRNA(Ile)-lysidine synthase [Bacteroidetes bacterium ADurb.Bin139]HOG24982.1 tRNA lysidine(34) synthetase TilS [Bacteroidales bacterium]HOR11005.1 tRNA lysidine(34) synthetase TilS [Bacteroidales bacterium]HOZ19134.1 tRNA lysidine(34) synthetase TilS [Bacteroidales bacterium]HPB77239.1 tRNA lysidine(34) synthetase TilS [Bacteroidales bacterium]